MTIKFPDINYVAGRNLAPALVRLGPRVMITITSACLGRTPDLHTSKTLQIYSRGRTPLLCQRKLLNFDKKSFNSF